MNFRECSSMEEQLAIQLEDGGSTPTYSHQYRIERIPHAEAKAFVEAWHYSKRMPTGKNICYGCWRGKDCYAVIIYGIGVNPYQASFLGVNSVVEIKRMCRREPKERFELSRLIGLTSRWLKKSFAFDAIVAFADPEQGHEGTVYKASGFKHEGMTNPEWHLIDKEGNVRHRKYAFRMARRNGISVQDARVRLGVSRIKTAPKHRWVRR